MKKKKWRQTTSIPAKLGDKVKENLNNKLQMQERMAFLKNMEPPKNVIITYEFLNQ